MTKIQLNDDEKRHIRLHLKVFKAMGYNWPGTFAYDPVHIPKKTFAALLTVAYSAIRIKPEPPVEVYALEITTRINYGMHGRDIHISEEAPAKPGGLRRYLSRLYLTKEDALLNRFKKLGGAYVKHLNTREITYYRYNQATFPIEKSENTIDLHSHLGGILSPPSVPDDLVRGVVFTMQGILCVDFAEFSNFVLSKAGAADLVEMKYKREGQTKTGCFVSAKKIHEFAKKYAWSIIDNLDNYVKVRGSPILIWETNKFGDILFYNTYEIA